MAKKKNNIKENKQKSLSSFVDNDNNHKTIKKETKFMDKSTKLNKNDKLNVKKRNQQINYFRGNNDPFGLKGTNFDSNSIKHESYNTKYLKYLTKQDKIVQELKNGILLDIDYDAGQNRVYCKFFDLDEGDIKIWIDNSNFKPYCLTKSSMADLKRNSALISHKGLYKLESVKKYDLLRDKEIDMVKIYGKSPFDIRGRNSIQSILGDNIWEANIHFYLKYIYTKNIIPGLIYQIKNKKIIKKSDRLQDSENTNLESEYNKLFIHESKEIQDFAKINFEIFFSSIPNIPRMAIDIEVDNDPLKNRVPDAKIAKQQIISIAFVTTDGLKIVYVLERDGLEFNGPHKDFPDDAKIIFFKSEKDLIIESFRLFWRYPVLFTFNGDNFDLTYMYHRANNLGVDDDLNPIIVKKGFGFMSDYECNLRKGIHVDLFNFFSNRSIQGYAFGGKYPRFSLNAISLALIGEQKYHHDEGIGDMTYDVLALYNLKDSILTLELTRFNNNLVWNLMILLCRISKLPLHDICRYQISNWIRSIFYYEHIQNNYLIPQMSEISDIKKGGYSKSIVDGKNFKGAHVIPPVKGIHFDVVVMDFSSLYPSIIKEYNLSYETILCPHKICHTNKLQGLPYHVCTKKMGVLSYIIGFFRDVRVKYFKPMSLDKKLTEEQRSYNNTIQQALKVYINGAYGVMGSDTFLFYCLPVAESTTGLGQHAIKSSIKVAKSVGVKVLYGDTDSIFLLHPSKEQMKEISLWCKNNLDLDLEEEKTYQFLALSDRKKNYLGVHKDTKYIEMKGLVAKKKNTPEFIKKVFNNLILILKNITNNDQFLKARTSIINLIRINLRKIGKPNTFTLEDYVINISLQKDLKNYIKVIPQHVRAAIEIERISGKKFNKGDVVSFIKSKGGSGTKVLELAKLQDIDIKKYKELLKSALEQVLDALDISFEEIKGIKKMDTFF